VRAGSAGQLFKLRAHSRIAKFRIIDAARTSLACVGGGTIAAAVASFGAMSHAEMAALPISEHLTQPWSLGIEVLRR
jgi:hypothetical protein